MKRSPDRVAPIVARVLAEQEEYRGSAGRDLARLWRDYLRRHSLKLGLALGFSIGWAAQPFAFALTARFLVDHVLKLQTGFLPYELPHQIRLLWLVIGLNAAIWACYLVCHWCRNWLIVRIGQRLVLTLRRQLHEKLQALHVGFYERVPAGRIMSRVLADVRMIQEWSTTQVVNMSAFTAKLVIGLSVLFYLDGLLALLVCVSLPCYAWAFYRLKPQVRRLHITLRRLASFLYGLAAERIAGVKVVKACGREKGELRSFTKTVFDAVRVHLRLVYCQQLLALVAGVITAVATGAVIYIAMLQVKSGVTSLGSALAFIGALGAVFQPVNGLTNQLTALQAVFVILRRVFSLLDEKVEIEPGAIHLTGMSGKIRFDRVTFVYPGQQVPALDEVSFRVEAGQRMAVMGPSGAGKSSLFSLLMRFYDPQQGEVRVGGVHLLDADPGSIRRHICMVQQEPTIFSGTLAENIMYGRLEATPAQVMRAAQRAEFHSFVMSLPCKYETEVGEGGVTLSGGQRQRLALATALLTDPEVLLLDDTTSALDARTEARIRATLNRILQGRTSLAITQRIATARDCDRIIVLEGGRVTQVGDHQTLSQQHGFYRTVCEQQQS